MANMGSVWGTKITKSSMPGPAGKEIVATSDDGSVYGLQMR
jgi:hypothetical protein